MSFSTYYLKSAVVNAYPISDVEIITPTGATIESPDLAAANKGGYELTPQSGPAFTVTAAQFAAYTKIPSTGGYVLSSNIVQAAQIAAVQIIVAGGSTVSLNASPLINEWIIQSTQAIVDNATFTSNYAVFS